jgi:hypothetical protein
MKSKASFFFIFILLLHFDQAPAQLTGFKPKPGSKINVAGLPDDALTERARSLLTQLDTLKLLTDSVDIIDTSFILSHLVVPNISFFSRAHNNFGIVARQIHNDESLQRSLMKNMPLISVRLDSLVMFTNKGFTWPTEFESELGHVGFDAAGFARQINFFPCCQYFFWYSEFTEVEIALEKHDMTLHGKTILDKDLVNLLRDQQRESPYYLAIASKISSTDKIILSIKKFTEVIDTLKKKIQIVNNFLFPKTILKKQNQRDFVSTLNTYLKAMIKSSKERKIKLEEILQNESAAINKKIDSVSELSKQLLIDSLALIKNNILSEENLIQQVILDSLYDKILNDQDSLIAASVSEIENIQFDDIDNSVTPEILKKIKVTNSLLNKNKAAAQKLRIDRISKRENANVLREENLRLLLGSINKRTEVNTLKIEINIATKTFFEDQFSFRREIDSLTNHLSFLSKVDMLFTSPHQSLVNTDIKTLLKENEVFKKRFDPRNPNNPLFIRTKRLKM